MNGGEISSTFRVGYRWRCSISASLVGLSIDGGLSLRCEWSPKVPKRLSPGEMADYRRGRDALLAEVARITGLRLLSAELGTGHIAVIDPSPARVGPVS
jgi:hypothetical protein